MIDLIGIGTLIGFIIVNKYILGFVLDKTIGKKKKEVADKFMTEYKGSMFAYFKEKDKKKKIKKAEEALLIQQKLAVNVLAKVVVVGIYIFIAIRILRWHFGSKILISIPNVVEIGWVYILILLVVLMFILRKIIKRYKNVQK